jgi:gas vesicle protein
MKISRRTRIIAALLAIFVMGVGAGFAIARAQKPAAAPAVEMAWAAQELRLLEERLQLTPEQVELLRPVFAESAHRMKQLRRETAEKLAGLIKDNTAQVTKELGPEQRQRLEEVLRERREQVERKRKSLGFDIPSS